MGTTGRIRERRVYEQPAPGDGTRVLVDRMWPRGMRKEDAPFDEWLKSVAPSSELRTWYGHAPERRAEFARRYRAELAGSPAAEGLERLRQLARKGPVTLLTATREVERSQLPVLRELLEQG